MKKLNTSQKQAVEYNDGPLLIVAGAGTGKTTVITEKISYIIEKNLAKPENILALTFTEKAASEMQERVDEMLDTGYVDLQISTFHAFCQRILEEYGIEIGLPLHFTLMTQTDVWLLMKKHIYDFDLEYYRPMGNPTGMIHEMIAHFSKAKDELISPEEYMAYAEGLGIDTDGEIKEKKLVTSNPKLVNKKDKKQVTSYKLQVTDATEIKKYTELANAYKTYNQLLLDNKALDFGDLMYYTVKLLKERPNVLTTLKKRFTHILVDEFQDVNWSQYQLIRMLTLGNVIPSDPSADGESRDPLVPSKDVKDSSTSFTPDVIHSGRDDVKLTVVGDDDQSIYSFRGSNVSIIMRFMDDFKDAKSIVLNENYRSGQEILDFSYESIKHNNPERLEETLKINKRLKSKGKRETCLPARQEGKVEHLHFQTLDDEVYGTIDKIKELIEKEDAKLDDIAILVRANAHIEPFVQALEQHEIPFEYIASSGLYRQPVVLDSMSFLQLLTHVYDDRAIYRLLRMPMFDMSENDIQKLTARAKQKSINYYEALKRGKEFHLSQNAINICDQVIELIHNGMKHARYEKPTVVLYHFLEQSGYLKHLTEGETAGDRNIIRQIYHVKQLFDMIRNFEMITPDSQVSEFIEYYNNIIESGDNGKMYQPGDTPDSVNIITVHSAKGLEYKYVFVVNMVEERFPTRRKGGGLDLPQALLKDTLPDNDFHYQEERRLFYVAATRAKEKLFLTSAEDYGGARKKKVSRFISELQLDTDEKPALETKHIDALHQEKKSTREDDELGVFEFEPPKKFSFSQINVYQRCPYQYKLANILKIPKKSGPALSFGNSIHNTLQAFYEKVRSLNSAKQDSLFGMPVKTSAKVDNGIKVPDEKYLLDLYEEKWIGDWYKSKQQRETYKKKGVELLKVFYASQEGKWTIPVSIEGGFKIKLGEYILGGRIDRIDQREDGTLEIIDYKTGTAKEKLTTDDKQQLLIYYIAATSLPEYKNIGPVGELTFYYVNSDTKLSFQGKQKDVDKLKEKILDTINNIHKGDFTATPNPFVCKYCDYKDICEFRKL